MKRYFLIIFSFALLLVNASAFAQDSVPKDSPERIPLELMMVYCMSSVIAGDDAAHVAEMGKLYELPAANAAAFLKGDEGRVFASPKDVSKAVLVVPENTKLGCSVLIRALDFDTFWTIADYWYGPESPFKVVSEKSDENSREKILKADIKGSLTLIVRARKIAEGGQIQGQIVAARTRD